MKSRAEECVIKKSLESFPKQAVKEMVACGMKYAGVPRFHNGAKQVGLKRFYDQRAFRREKVVDILVLKKLELTAREIDNWIAERTKVTRYDAEHWTAIARL